MIKKGKFIVLEGLDRSGKSSIARFISELLSQKQQSVFMINFPDRTTSIGLMINDYLKQQTELSNEAIHLLFSANRWEKVSQIKATLEAGTHIICDRYWYSGVAYSLAKGMDYEWCKSPDRGLIEPDMVIYLKASPAALSKRANYGEERFQRLQFQEKVKEGFERLFLECPQLKTVQVGDLPLEQVKKLVDAIVLSELTL